MLFSENLTLSTVQATATQAPSAADTLITVEDVSKSHDGMRFLFEELSFSLARGERMAIIGANGSGVPTRLSLRQRMWSDVRTAKHLKSVCSMLILCNPSLEPCSCTRNMPALRETD